MADIERALALDTSDSMFWLNKGRALLHVKRFDEAVKAFEQAAALAPNVSRPWYWKGVALGKQERYTEAIAAYDQALVLNPADAWSWNNKAANLSKLGHYDEATQASDESLRLDNTNIPAWRNRGVILHYLERHDEALACWDRVLALAGDDAMTHAMRGSLLCELGRYDEAIEAFDRSLSLDAKNAWVWCSKGWAYRKSQRYEDALSCFERALAISPDYTEAARERAAALYGLKRFEEALPAYERALELEPRHAGMNRFRCKTLVQLKRYAEAASAYEQALALWPDSIEFRLEYGSVLLTEHRNEEAFAEFKRVLADDPGNAGAFRGKAEALFAILRYDEALTAYDEALKIDPKRVVAWKGKVWTLFQLGRFEEALAAAKEAEQSLPDSTELRSQRQVVERSIRRTIPDKQMRLRNGRTLGYLDYGDPQGMPIICCHGVPGSRLDFSDDEDLLRSLHVRLLVPDRPGYGLSDFQRRRRILDWPDDVAQLADHLGIERFIVLGVSGGGAYAAACARTLPHRVIRLGLVSSAAPTGMPGNMRGMATENVVAFMIAKYMPWPLYWPFVTLLAWMTKKWPLEAYRAYRVRFPKTERAIFNVEHLPPAAIEHITEPFRQGGRGNAWDMRLQARAWGFRLHDIAAETYLWHGERDTLAPSAMGHYLAHTIPNCHATFYPDEGHLLINTHWREIIETLIKEPMQARR